MKGILLAGGTGSRLYPLTASVNKHLLPVFDKPLIYYPLTTLMLAEIKDILVITRPDQLELYRNLLKDGKQWGIKISYATQEKPGGIAEAFSVGEAFIGTDNVCLILGDNIYYGSGLSQLLIEAKQQLNGATIFGYSVSNPERYGVAHFSNDGNIIGIEEKPKNPPSNYAITGLYFYDNKVIEITKSLKPSARGELEITDVNNMYLKMNQLTIKKLSRGFAWLDAGTPRSLLEASEFVASVEKRQGQKVCCPEETAWRKGYISNQQLQHFIEQHPSKYTQYLSHLLAEQQHENIT
ncbi:MAG: glucose-1-phosphate thymidylyltransferase RfbA [Gammaproteobacteria bacterium]|nr:glucose-1-phosphate thymidylyltransferase RfbA [Gammaproteobacteria bacterium]